MSLIEQIDRAIAGMGRLGRREAFAALQDVFARVKQQPSLGEAELKRFFDMVTLVFLVYPRGMTIRISGPKTGSICEEKLDFNDVYEAALDRTMDFLARNFLTHIDEYEPQQYLRAALRTLAKEYSRERAQRRESVPVDSFDETVEDEVVNPERDLAQEEAPAWLRAYDYVREDKPDGEIFHGWFVGNLARAELAAMYHKTPAQVNEAILRVARQTFEQGRLYPLVSSLVRLDENGDIFWLWLKGLTAQQIGEKVAKSHWVVYKRLETVRRKFARLRGLGRTGRRFGAWLCGVNPELIGQPDVRWVLERHGAELGLENSEFGVQTSEISA
jgi:hypothetical protein